MNGSHERPRASRAFARRIRVKSIPMLHLANFIALCTFYEKLYLSL